MVSASERPVRRIRSPFFPVRVAATLVILGLGALAWSQHRPVPLPDTLLEAQIPVQGLH